MDPSTRSATGFLVDHHVYGSAILTALHAVIGQGDIFYQFHNAGKSQYSTNIVSVNADADLALLAAPPVGDGVTALDLAVDDPLVGDETVYVLGHASQTPIPLDTKGRARWQGKRLGDLLKPEYAQYVDSLAFPSLEMSIITVQGAIRPGDSGAPVFDESGRVVAVANGGIPDSDGHISWAVRISNVQDLVEYDGLSTVIGSPNVSRFDYAMQVDHLFYLDDFFQDDRELSLPIPRFALRFKTTVTKRMSYIEAVEGWDEDYFYRFTDEAQHTAFGALPIIESEAPFPGIGSLRDFGYIAEDLSALLLDITCFSRDDRMSLVTMPSMWREIQPLMSMTVPLGNLETLVRQGRIEMSITAHFQSFLSLYGVEPIMIDVFRPGVTFERGYDKPRELLAGMCRIELDEHPGVSSYLEEALVLGVGIFRLQITERLALDFWPPAVIPDNSVAGGMSLWSMLPSTPFRPEEDGLDMFTRH